VPGLGVDVFFYGLFMYHALLREKGLHPTPGRKAVAPGQRLIIGRRAALAPEFGAQAFGIVYGVSSAELDVLYSAPGLERYRPRPLVVVYEDGTSATVATYNLESPAEAGKIDATYAAKLHDLIGRLDFPRAGSSG
jgi:hypothetical protein